MRDRGQTKKGWGGFHPALDGYGFLSSGETASTSRSYLGSKNFILKHNIPVPLGAIPNGIHGVRHVDKPSHKVPS
jgi:hypothetical protein